MASSNQYAFLVHHRGERVLIDDGSISIFLLMPITRAAIFFQSSIRFGGFRWREANGAIHPHGDAPALADRARHRRADRVRLVSAADSAAHARSHPLRELSQVDRNAHRTPDPRAHRLGGEAQRALIAG